MFDLVSQVASNVVSNGIAKLVSGDSDSSKENTPATTETKAPDTSGFDRVLRTFLPAEDSSQVSEEDLFAASAGERVQALKGEDGLKAYQTALDAEKQSLKTAGGYVPVEQATINALKKLVSDGTLSKEEGDKVYSEAFSAAQLDADTSSLFDSIGEGSDPTKAVSLMSEAMTKIKTFVDGLATTPLAATSLKSLETAIATGGGGVSPASASLALGTGVSESGAVTPNGTYVDGSEGFLFKPKTNNEGALALLFAQSWTHNIAGVNLLDSTGNLIESGVRKPEGISETGREKFTFSRQGGDYQKNITVEVTFKDGNKKTYSIPDPSKRYD